MALTQRGFQTYDGSHAPDYVKNGNFVLNKDSPQARGLLAWYPMAPVGGRTLVDFSGNEHHGIFEESAGNAPTWVRNEFGAGAVRSDGVEDLNDSKNIRIDGAWPRDPSLLGLSCWARRDSTAQGGVLIGHRDEATRLIQVFIVAGGNDAAFQLRSSGNSLKTVTASNIDTSITHHYYAELNKAGNRHPFYIDGIEKGADATNFGAEDFDSAKQTLLDTNTTNYGVSVHDGPLWDVRAYNISRSAGEVWQFFNPFTRWDLYHELGLKSFSFPNRVPATPFRGGAVQFARPNVWDVKKKPEKWDADKSKVDPRWGWFYFTKPLVWPMWEGGGSAFPVGSRSDAIALASGVTWGTNMAGRALDFDGGTNGVDGPVVDLNGHEWTIALTCTVNEEGADHAMVTQSVSAGDWAVQLWFDTVGSALRWGLAIFDGATASTDFAASADPNIHYKVIMTHDGNQTTEVWTERGVLGFEKLLQITDRAPQSISQTLDFGHFAGSSKLHDGTIGMAVYDPTRKWNDYQIRQWALDPFGPIRPMDRVGIHIPIGITLAGTASPTMTEAEAVAGGKTVTLDVRGDTWIS